MSAKIRKYCIFALLACIAVIWWNSIILIVSKYVIPITQVVPQHSWLAQCVLCVAVLIWYTMHYKSILLEENIWQERYEDIFMLVAIYLPFRLFGPFLFYGIVEDVCYLDVCCIEIGVIEIILMGYRISKSRINKIEESKYSPFCVDSPATCSAKSDEEDWYQRFQYADLLLEKIIATYQTNKKSENAFTILLNERYGIGKTSFFNRIEILAKARHVDVMWFKPWLNSGEDRIVTHFFDALQSKLDADDHALTRLLKIYSKVTTHPLSKSTTQELLSIFSTPHTLDDMHNDIAERLKEREKPLLVLVDDVDRLLPLEMMSLLRLIRNTADFPNMVYLVAADKVAMSEALHCQHIDNPSVYLEKFFNYEFLFPANEDRIGYSLILHLTLCLAKYDFDEGQQSDARYYIETYEYSKTIFKSPRDVKRFINILSFALDSMKVNGIIDDVYLPDLLAVCLIQYLDEDIYKILRDANETLLSFSTNSEEYALKKEYEEASRSLQDFQHTQKMLENRTIEKQKQPNMEYKDLKRTLSEQTPSIDLIVAKLLYKLFNGHTGRGSHRISYSYEYFKYFAGRYRSNELSNAQANAIWGMELQNFEPYICEAIKPDKYASLMHKFDLYIATERHNNLEMIQKLLFVFNKVMDIEIEKTRRCDACLYFRNCTDVQYKIRNLYVSEYTIPASIADRENAELSEFFIRNDNFMNHAMTLLAFRRIDRAIYNSSFTNDMCRDWEEIVIRRFFVEAFVKEPLSHLRTIPFIRELDPFEYKSHFADVIAKSKNPLDWIFCCVECKGGKYYWKEDVLHGLYDDATNSLFATIQEYMKPYMSAEIAQDFEKLFVRGTISKAMLKDHSFLQAWEERTNRK